MRPSYHEGVDTLRPEELPPVDGCQIDYCPPLEPTANRTTVLWFLCVAAISTVAILAARLSGTYFPLVAMIGAGYIAGHLGAAKELAPLQQFLPMLMVPIAIVVAVFVPAGSFTEWFRASHEAFSAYHATVFTLIGVGIGGYLWNLERPAFEVIAAGSSGLAIVVFTACINQLPTTWHTFSLIGLVAVILTVALSNAIVDQYCGALRCRPRLTDDIRSRWQYPETVRHSSWTGRYVGAVTFSVLLSLATLFVIRAMASAGTLHALAGAVTMILLTVIVGCLAAAASTAKRVDETRAMAFENTILATLRAIRHWLVYEPNPHAAGVYRTEAPWVPSANRRFAMATCLVLYFAAVLPAACYFPIGLARTNQWKRALAEENGSLALEGSNFLASLLVPVDHDSGQLADPVKEWRNGIRSDFAGFVNRSPEHWIPLTFEGLGQGRPLFLATILLSVLLSTLIPPTLFLCLVATLAGPVLARAEAELTGEVNLKPESDWDGYVERIQESDDPIERDSLLIGTHESAGYPVLVHRSTLREHGHILGDTGSGKTAIAFAPMMTQLIRMSGRDLSKTEASTQQSSIVVIDLKGDRALFHGAQLEAMRAGLPFRWFTNKSGDATYAFNPFLQSHVKHLTTSQWAQTLTDALSLSHGEGFGEGFFSAENEDVLASLLEAFDGRISSFRELSEYCNDQKSDLLGKKLRFDRKKKENASALFTMLKRLAPIDALNVKPGDYPEEVFSEQIDLPSTFDTPQVVYFFLKSGIEAASTSRIGKLALYGLFSAAANKPPRSGNQVYLFIDEFQQIASQSIEKVLRQARSMNMATILAHQSVSDLVINDTDITPTVQANTRFKQFFAATDREQQDSLSEGSGETIDYVLSWTGEDDSKYNSHGKSERDERNADGKETVVPRINQNDIIRITDDAEKSVFQLSRGAGYAKFGGFPFIVSGTYHISEAEYERRKDLPWPESSEHSGTIVPDRQSRSAEVPAKSENTKRPQSTAAQSPEGQTTGFEDVFDELDSEAKKRQARRRKRSQKQSDANE